MLHPREGTDYELAPGYYVLREVVSRSADGGITYGIVSRTGEDEEGTLIADGDTHILPGYALHAFAGIGIKARESKLLYF